METLEQPKNVEFNKKFKSLEGPLPKPELKQPQGLSMTKENKETIKNLLKEVLYNSFAQAIIKIFLTPYHSLRIFLIISSLGASCMASFLVIQSILTYFTYEVSTTSRTIYETPTLFPQVTFCNVNPITTKYGYEQYPNGYQNITSNEEKKRIGHDLNDILISCTYNAFQCNTTFFHWSFDEKYGNCYSFNSGYELNGKNVEYLQSNFAGPETGLQLKLYVNVYEQLLENVAGLGALIRIGNNSFLTYYQNSGIFILPGTNAYLPVYREFKSILPKPYSNCEVESNAPKVRSDSDLYNLIGQSEYVYTQQLCFLQCFQKYILQTYACTLTAYLSLFNARKCNYSEEIYISSTDKVMNKIDDRRNFINQICVPLCPLECNLTLYETSVSSYYLNGKKHISIINNNTNLASDFVNRSIDATAARDSFVQVNVFYESLSYTLTTESPTVNWVSLLGSIGGNLGLFLGVSVFSLCEVVEVLIEMFFLLRTKKKIDHEK